MQAERLQLPWQKEPTTMKFHQLLHQRDALLRHARLANLAFAHHQLVEFGRRIARARLCGSVTLSLADPSDGRHWPTLLAHEGNQSLIEEHFLDEDMVELADILSFLHEGENVTEFTFRLEELENRFLPGLRRELVEAGVLLEPDATSPADSGLPQA